MPSPVTIGDITVNPGERGFSYLHIGTLAGGTEVRIPYQVIVGAEDGPTLCLESTMHGWEPMGAEIIRRATQRIDPKTLKGTVLCIPLASPMTIEFGGTIESAGMRVNPVDVLDLNRVWPGKNVNAWLTEQIAYHLWTEIVSKADFIVDMHDGTGACDELPVAFPQAFPSDPAVAIGGGVADGTGTDASEVAARITTEYLDDMKAKIREMSIAWGSPVIWWREKPINPAMLSGQCAINGIVPLVVECGGGGMIDFTIDQGAECTLNILKHLGMMDGDPVLPKKQIMVENYVVYRSLSGGFYIQEEGIELGMTLTKGQVIGRVVDPLTSEVRETCTSPVNGMLISRRVRMPINPGGYIAHIADTDSVIWSQENS
ncbi:MAG: succinylglutamate desuccinylase/aspartoacylase family protein [Caldilineaceae bacterium]|nr:succinylglutamate desuccinylase/aspartoacylase family protein [Caldilineaceae bacterium]